MSFPNNEWEVEEDYASTGYDYDPEDQELGDWLGSVNLTSAFLPKNIARYGNDGLAERLQHVPWIVKAYTFRTYGMQWHKDNNGVFRRRSEATPN